VRRVGATLLALGVLVGIIASPASAGHDRCTVQRCTDYHVPVPRGVHVTSDVVRVILPEDYATSGKRYPVVYLFGGALGGYREWTYGTPIADYARNAGAIFVLPDGGAARQAGWYSDWYDGSYQWETWHIGTVLPWVDAHFRTIPGDRAVMGASMGANGALEYAARHPHLFRAAVSLSGWVDTQQLTPLTGMYADSETTVPMKLSSVWGDQLRNADVWAAHNPTALAAGLRGTTVFVCARTGDPSEKRGGRIEMQLFAGEPDFLAALDANGVTHVDRIREGGGHDWLWFWQDAEWALPQVLALLRTPAQAPGPP
jgi:S-formylglutathione hydrolase FrmB